MRSIKIAITALFAVMAVGALAAVSASAFHPLFFTLSGSTLPFTGSGGTSTLRGLNLKVLGTIVCEKNASKGEILNKSTRAVKVEVEFSGKCEQTINGTKETCTEPIKVKTTYGELGLASSTGHTVLLLLAPESGTEFVKVVCTNNNTTVEGTIVGVFPEKVGTVNQYNKVLSSFELVFESESANENQKVTEIFLLGSQMKTQELKVSGFFGGKASEEASGTIKPDGPGEISTK